VPNQLLVKFQPEAEGGPEAGLEGEQAGVGVTKSLEGLSQRFRIRKSEGLFPEFAKHQRKM